MRKSIAFIPSEGWFTGSKQSPPEKKARNTAQVFTKIHHSNPLSETVPSNPHQRPSSTAPVSNLISLSSSPPRRTPPPPPPPLAGPHASVVPLHSESPSQTRTVVPTLADPRSCQFIGGMVGRCTSIPSRYVYPRGGSSSPPHKQRSIATKRRRLARPNP